MPYDFAYPQNSNPRGYTEIAGPHRNGSGMVHIRDLLLIIEKSTSCSGDSVRPLSLSDGFSTICLTLYNH